MSEQSLPVVPTPAEAEPDSLYKFSEWCHVGAGAAAEQFEDDRFDRCENPAHFHAWCRIPNDFQEREIRDHARAAAARKKRQMRLDGTDANAILEGNLEELRDEDEWREITVSELVGSVWFEAYNTAVREVRDVDADDADEDEAETPVGKLFVGIDADMTRLQRLLGDGAEDGDELSELRAHVASYTVKVQEHVEALIKPKQTMWESLGDMDLLDTLRKARVKRAGAEEYLHHFEAHVWLACSYTHVNGEPCFADLKAMEKAPAEVLRGLRETHKILQGIAQGALGN